MDMLSPNERSRLMRSIGASGTAPERVALAAARQLGLRPTINARDLPGTPDLVLRSRRIAIFVHGCFWHSHRCRRGRLPATRRDFWKLKLERNRARDRRVSRKLRAMGWRVVVVWECEISGRSAR
jgi:DNA mismatch endonuclease (patch repair protein)